MKQTPVWREPNFIPLWIGSSLSSLADSAYYIVLAWFVLRLTHSDADLATTLLLASLPRLLFMLIGGVVVDRISPRLLMLVSLAIRAGILLGLAAWLAQSHVSLHVTALYVVATLFGVVDAFYWPTQSALVPHALSPGTLPVANSFIQTAQQLSMVLGPLLAGAILQLRHFSWIFSIVAGLYAISVAAISFIHIGPREVEEKAVQPNIWREVGDGVRYVLGIRILLFLMLASMLINLFFMGPVNIGLPSLVQDRGWSGTIYGYLESAIGLGAVAGGGFTVLMKGMRGHFRWIALSAAGIGLGLSAASVVTHWEWGVVFMAASGAAMSITNIPVITYVQTIVEKSMMGRVMSLLTLMSVGLTPVSYGLSALILRTRLLSPQGLMMVGGLVIALFCAALIFQPDFRHMESHPRWKHAELESTGGVKQ